MKQSTSDVLNLRLLFRYIENMQTVHAAGHTWYEYSVEGKNSTYGWHNPLFPPEFRRCCLNGKNFNATPSCDLYYFMADYYENLTCHKAPHNFELNPSWKNCVAENSTACSKTQQKAITDMIAGCTRWKNSHRIANANELLKTDFIKSLI